MEDRTSRPWNFEAEFPLEAWVTPVGLSIDSAIGLLPNLETAQRERSVLLWMNKIYILLKERKKGLCVEHQNGFYELLTKPRMKAI